jgi:sec-independent protein translocase protein TatB
MVIVPTVMAADIGMADSLILMVMALVVVGPRRLPQLGRQIGKLMYEFRKASNDFKFQMEEELRTAEEADRRKKEEEERQRQLAANPPAQIEASTTAATSTIETPEAASTDYRDPYAYGYSELTEESIRIQPPSTGEQVAAERPTGSQLEPQSDAASADAATADAASADAATADAATADAAAAELAAEPSGVSEHEDASGTSSTAPQEPDKTIEPAAHNG